MHTIDDLRKRFQKSSEEDDFLFGYYQSLSPATPVIVQWVHYYIT